MADQQRTIEQEPHSGLVFGLVYSVVLRGISRNLARWRWGLSLHSMIRFEPLPGKETEFRNEVLRVSERSRTEPAARVDVFEFLHEPFVLSFTHSEGLDERFFELHTTLPTR